MGSVLLKQVTVTDAASPFNGKTVDVLIKDGKVAEIGATVNAADAEIYDFKGCLLSPGWVDMRATVPDPGFEYKEDIASLQQVAAAGGFTTVCVLPETKPVMQNKTAVEYLLKQSAGHAVSLLPLGAVTKNLTEDDITEMYDMQLSGAVAFANGNHAIHHAGVMHRALLYAKNFDGLVYSFPYDDSIAGKGQMAEGRTSTYMGVKGIPAVAELLMVQRDIELARYNNARVHFSKISTAAAVAAIRKAKAEGLRITADVAIANLANTDAALEDFDSNLKVLPPLRPQSDIDALIEGLKDGTIDAICSDHTPEDTENKVLEFDYAAFGAIQLQTLLPLALKALSGKMKTAEILEKLYNGPRMVLNLPMVTVKAGETANFTICDPNASWTFDASQNQSRSANSHLLGTTLTGRAMAICNNGKLLQV